MARALDADALARLRRTMGDEFGSMLAEFLDASEATLQTFEAACAHRRWPDAERHLHTLKSMARMVGARALADRCAEGEAMARGGLPGEWQRQLRGDVAAAQEAVRAWPA